MPCCRCNRSGRCRNCSCVKAGSTCQNCLPQRLGNCSNNGSTTTPITTPPQILFQIPEHHTTVSIAAPDEGSPMNTADDGEVDFWISKWISGFQIGFLDFRVDFWISLDFGLDFCRQCTRFLSWRIPRDNPSFSSQSTCFQVTPSINL